MVTDRNWFLRLFPELARVPGEERWTVYQQARRRVNGGISGTVAAVVWFSSAVGGTFGWYMIADHISWDIVWDVLGEHYSPKLAAGMLAMPLMGGGLFVSLWVEWRVRRRAIIHELSRPGEQENSRPAAGQSSASRMESGA